MVDQLTQHDPRRIGFGIASQSLVWSASAFGGTFVLSVLAAVVAVVVPFAIVPGVEATVFGPPADWPLPS